MTEGAPEEISTGDLDKCIKQFVLIAVGNVKFLSSRKKTGLFIVKLVS